MAPTTDFVEVKLSARGAELAGPGGAVGAHGSTYDFEVGEGQTLRVTRGEWEEILSKRADADAKPLFELAARPAPPSRAARDGQGSPGKADPSP